VIDEDVMRAIHCDSIVLKFGTVDIAGTKAQIADCDAVSVCHGDIPSRDCDSGVRCGFAIDCEVRVADLERLRQTDLAGSLENDGSGASRGFYAVAE